MYDLNPPFAFAHERVFKNPAAGARIERILAALGNPPVETVGLADTDRGIELTRPPAAAGGHPGAGKAAG